MACMFTVVWTPTVVASHLRSSLLDMTLVEEKDTQVQTGQWKPHEFTGQMNL